LLLAINEITQTAKVGMLLGEAFILILLAIVAPQDVDPA
jgi:hypothetical protein